MSLPKIRIAPVVNATASNFPSGEPRDKVRSFWLGASAQNISAAPIVSTKAAPIAAYLHAGRRFDSRPRGFAANAQSVAAAKATIIATGSEKAFSVKNHVNTPIAINVFETPTQTHVRLQSIRFPACSLTSDFWTLTSVLAT